jgi:PhnB protein
MGFKKAGLFMKRAFLQIYVKGRDEAIEVYKRAFNATLGFHEINPDGTFGHVELDVDGQAIAVGEDHEGSDERITGNTMQYCLHFGDGEDDKVRNAYEVLKEGGTVNYPLGPSIFSTCATDLVDKFGVRWCLFV